VPRTGVDGGADKNRLARHRKARALQHHDHENSRISVVGDEALNQGSIEKGHGAYHYLMLKNAIGWLRRRVWRPIPLDPLGSVMALSIVLALGHGLL
jgi:hypothetical protein